MDVVFVISGCSGTKREDVTPCGYMAWNIRFTKDGRQRLAGVLRALLIAQLAISLIIVIFCYNVSVKVMSLLKHIHKVTVILLYGLILLHAYCMKLHYTSGFRLISWLLRRPHWSRAASVTRLWLVSGCLVALNGLLVHAACKSTLKALMKELSSSLRIGISHYLSEPMWKRIMDTMQVELNCCGVESPSDWNEIPWINMDFLNEDSELVIKLCGMDGRAPPPVSPYSCCAPNVLAACCHDPLQQPEWSPCGLATGATLSARACRDAVRAPLTRAALALHALGALAILLQVQSWSRRSLELRTSLQLVVVAVTQLVVRSALHAVARGDWAHHGRTQPRAPRSRVPEATSG